MITTIFIGLFSFTVFSTPITQPLEKEPVCRMTCTVIAPDGNGGHIAMSARAGGPFTSCAKAAEKACDKATEMLASEY